MPLTALFQYGYGQALRKFKIFETLFFVPSLYVAAAACSAYFNDEASASIISWCATSVLLALLIRKPTHIWLPLIVNAAIGDFIAHILKNTSNITIVGIVLADIFEVVFTAAIFNRFDRRSDWYLSVKIVLTLAVAILFASISSTVLEIGWISLFVPSSEQPFIKARSFTEALDLLVALPLALSWTDPSLLSKLSIPKFVQIAVLTIAAVIVSYALLASGTPFLFLAIPVLLLATLSGGLLGSTAAVFGLSLVVRWFTFDGPSKIISSGGSENTELLIMYHMFIVTAILSSIPLGILLARLESSAERLRDAGAAADRARQEAEAARDRAETAGRAKGEFLSVMSHELRTPMTGVLGLVDLLSKESMTTNQKTHLNYIRQSGQHLLNVINDILDFTKIDTGKLEIESTTCSITSVFENVCATSRPLCKEKNIAFIAVIDEQIPEFVIGDPTRIQQVLLNLVSNAIKFTSSGSVKVTASHRTIDEDVLEMKFEVQDTGIGIAQGKQSEVFLAFTQEDKSTARRYGGSGLGLAICKRLVVAMGGEINFISSPSIGTTFWFSVPVLKIKDSVPAVTNEDRVYNLRPCRILIAEDIALNRSIIRSMLASDRHTIVFAQNGAEAVEWASHRSFDLILMDVQMPVMDGVEATQRIRKLDAPAKHTPIVALTANVFESERRLYLDAGMDVCVAKPIDWNALNATIAKYTSPRHSLSVTGTTPSDGFIALPFDAPPEPQSFLIDIVKLRSLKEKLGKDLKNLLVQAIENAEHACDQIELREVSGGHKAKEIHALKGMAGMLGLLAIQRLSEELEVGLGVDSNPENYGSELREIIMASRAALVRAAIFDDVDTTFFVNEVPVHSEAN